jgi:peptide/nickel transport system permease protein
MALGVPLGLLPPANRGSLARRDHHARQRPDLRLPQPVIAILITARLRPRRDQRHHRHRHLQHPGLRPRRARRRAAALDARLHPGARGWPARGATRISVEHILPNIANLLIVQATIQFSLGILAEAALSYVGLGAQPPTPAGAGCWPRRRR